ncbi:RNA polymerase sigma factor [Dactylosporangium sp. CA-233914]|uniref:RNA polymerase sigma factor n=1 Tax=Dactylosporangium sp. CA-233914 TaxID=3239934 RepID=UPI003D8A9245
MAVIEQDEALLWRRACGGDAQAFAAVFDLHRDRVYGQAVRLLDTRSDAEDVTASTFLELWRRRAVVRLVNGSVLPWLLVTTANLARNAARARRRYRDFLARLPHEPAASDAADVALAGRDVGVDPRLRQALRSLPERDMALLLLVAYEDCAVADAAALLGMTPAAAKTRLHRTRHRIREQLPDFPAALDRTGAL